MISSKMVCNICGREMDVYDRQEDFSIHKRCGYGTKYDGETLSLDICCECMERLIDSCRVSPIESGGGICTCSRCGNHFQVMEHTDDILCADKVWTLCPECAKYLFDCESELKAFAQKIETMEERRLHRKHE